MGGRRCVRSARKPEKEHTVLDAGKENARLRGDEKSVRAHVMILFV